MYTNFTIKNFRIFDKEGTTIPLRTITLLTGCNNSGKSSIVKALCLLKDFCQQLESDIKDGRNLNLGSYKMDFHKSPNNLLGTFDLVQHFERTNDDNCSEAEVLEGTQSVVLELVVESSWLLQDVILHLEFGSLEWDDLNNGYLLAYSIKTLDEKVIYEADRNGKLSYDFSLVKKSFLYFIYGQHASAQWQNEAYYRMGTGEGVEDDDKDAQLFDESTKNILKDLGPSAFIYLLEWQISHCSHQWRDGISGAAESILKYNISPSFVINSPKLGVYCYFPCLEIFKDMDKTEIRQAIYNKINSQQAPISPLNKEKIDVFLDSFENSEAITLHEFISQKENERYFINIQEKSIMNRTFALPDIFWNAEIGSCIDDESQLPEEANWDVVLSAMDLINQLMTDSSSRYVSFHEIDFRLCYNAENALNGYFKNIIEDVFVHIIPGPLSYSPTTIVQPRRMYSLEENSDFAQTLKNYFEAKRIWEESKGMSSRPILEKGIEYQPCMFINKWLNQLGIAHHVVIQSHAGGYGVTIHLYEDEDDKDGMLLADKGFGVLQLFVFLLKIEISILEMKTNEKLYVFDTTGLNPDLIKYLRTYNQLHPITVALEEPECHLHPSLQSKIADMIVEANKQFGIHFIIESHSEYLIRKLQLLVSQEEIGIDNISLLYVNQKSRPNYLPVLTDIGINEDGTLKNEFGKGFYDESLRLSKELFNFKKEDDEEQA